MHYVQVHWNASYWFSAVFNILQNHIVTFVDGLCPPGDLQHTDSTKYQSQSCCVVSVRNIPSHCSRQIAHHAIHWWHWELWNMLCTTCDNWNDDNWFDQQRHSIDVQKQNQIEQKNIEKKNKKKNKSRNAFDIEHITSRNAGNTVATYREKRVLLLIRVLTSYIAIQTLFATICEHAALWCRYKSGYIYQHMHGE